MRRNVTHPQLRVEPLEDRLAPTVFAVTTGRDVVDPADGKLSLREAVGRANAHPGVDTVALPAGTFRLGLAGAGEDGNATGDLDVTDGLIVQGSGAGVTVVDGRQLDRLFDALGAAGLKLVGVTLQHGAVAGDGGAVHTATGNLSLVNCVVGDNRGLSGGGIATDGGNVKLFGTAVVRNVAQNDGGGVRLGSGALTVSESVVRRNLSGGKGGGISADKSVTATKSTFAGNSAAIFGGGLAAGTATLTDSLVVGNTAGRDGGGIYAPTAATLTNCNVSGNHADSTGGGIEVIRGTLTNCAVRGNDATNSGGGIFAVEVTITNCTVGGNHAGVDGGGLLAAGTAALTGCTVSGNTASHQGGGINATAANLTNSTVVGNTALSGGGIFAVTASLLNCTVVENGAMIGGGGIFHAAAGGAFRVTNTILALNLADFGGGPDVSGDFASGGHNLIGDGTGGTGFTNATSADLVGTSAAPLDPKLGPLANNGGPTKTMALLPGSPAIDHGDNAAIPASDQRGAGFPRGKDGDHNGIVIVDIGAFEL